MKLRISLLIVLCLLCLLNFKVQWDRYEMASSRRVGWIRSETSGNCFALVWDAKGVTPEPGDSWKVCRKDSGYLYITPGESDNQSGH